ncbi:gluconate 2-dehydrogenase subunit 3 family protein [Roseomonas stagni]|uniref:Gluconate 2-dehydrogenase subunit 3 family protein n=1 Tax=Falsiroseomonas algicola TaxID=2716930 RepID=A0A6M1LDN0_9PROT|nr:gluconate 2-dehydrogenase subunit 3 family protein [Falsiroseomonas algicola]NGM18393.1 gluconate 2-dehydrogenase subunit 3 family protein [Falsiroseomonas algicola]
MSTPDLSRRGLLIAGGTAAATPVVVPAQAQPHAHGQAPAAPPAPHVWEFFTGDEAAMVSAAMERLIPADPESPGAIAAGVPEFIDRQLAGSYGTGSRLYRQGPFREGTAEQGYQLPFTPATLYRAALPAFAGWTRQNYGRAFQDLDQRLQDEVLRKLETGEAVFEAAPSSLFFETLLANTIEGFFSDPIHGGNRDMIGWKLVGFPGPYAGYVELVGRHNLRFDRTPRGIAQAMAEHAHHAAPMNHR